MFAEHLRLTSIAGETPLAKTLCSLTSEVEKEVGTLASRLYRVVRTKPVEGKCGEHSGIVLKENIFFSTIRDKLSS